MGRPVEMKKQDGSIGNLMVTGICVLAMTAVMVSYMNCAEIIQQKIKVSQLARKYILKMETTGCLNAQDRIGLCQELENLGVTEINLLGTTVNEVPYSTPIVLEIRGKLRKEYAFEEKRVSTSKN